MNPLAAALGKKAGNVIKKVGSKVGDALHDAADATPLVWKGTVDNSKDPTSALSMLRRKVATKASPLQKQTPVGNGLINTKNK